jgi:hypothetical protein
MSSGNRKVTLRFFEKRKAESWALTVNGLKKFWTARIVCDRRP